MMAFLCVRLGHKWTQWFTVQFQPPHSAVTQIGHCKRCLDIEQR